MPSTRILFSVLVGVAALAAQEPDASRCERLVRIDDVFVVSFDGPARLRQKFLPTDLGTMLAAKEAADFWGLLRELVSGGLSELSDTEDSPRAGHLSVLTDAFAAYGGRIRMGVGTVPRENSEPGVDGVLVFGPDAAIDTGALRTALADALGDLRGERRTLTVAGTEVTVLAVGGGPRAGITLPITIDGYLVTFFGDDVETTMGQRLQSEDTVPFVGDADFRAASFAAQLNVPELLRVTGGADLAERAAMGRLGLASLASLRWTARPRGPHVQFETSAAFVAGADRGLFGGVLPAIETPSRLSRFVPADARHWYAGKLLVTPIYQALLAVISGSGWTDSGVDELRAEVKETLGFDVEDDLLAHVGEDIFWVGTLGAASVAEEDPRLSGASYFVITLVDPVAFAARWNDLFAAKKMSIEFDVERREGLEVNVGLYGNFAWAIDADVLVLSAGDDPAEGVFTFLEHRRAVLATGEEKTDLPDSVRRAARAAPPGMQGVGSFDIDELLSQGLWGLLDFEIGMPRSTVEALVPLRDQVRPLLEQYGLARPTMFTSWRDDTWSYRILW